MSKRSSKASEAVAEPERLERMDSSMSAAMVGLASKDEAKAAGGKKKEDFLAKSVERATAIAKDFPDNRAVKHFLALHGKGKLASLDSALVKRLLRCINTGLENHDSGLGCYAMSPSDYEDLSLFFDAICNDYHNNPGGEKTHTTNWSLKGVEGLPADGQLDISKLGLKEVGAWGHCGRGNRKGCALISCAVLAARCRRDSLFFF